MIVPALALAVAATVLWRRRLSNSLEREWLARHPPGPDGIVAGAGPIMLPGTGTRAVLVLHGFGDTPQSLRHLAAHLQAAGFTVHAPLLPGHGRTPREFDAVTSDELIDAARTALRTLRERYAEVALVGVSMGGAIAAILAAEQSPPALVLVAPYLEMRPSAEWSTRMHWAWGWMGPFVRSGGDLSISDPEERGRSLSYGIVTSRVLRMLHSIAQRGSAMLPGVTAPTLMIQSREDNRIAAQAAERAFGRIGSTDKRLVWAEDGRHVLTVDFGHERVQQLATDWILSHSGH
jgi:carboxylesterase